MSLSKKQLIAQTAEDQGLTIARATAFVDAFLKNVEGELKKGGSVNIFEFGSFKVVEKEARNGRNPSTGAPMRIEAKRVVKFTPATVLKDSVNE